MKKIISTLIYLSFAVLVFAGCGEPKKADMASVTSPSTSEVPADTPLYIKLAAQWEGEGTSSTYEVIDTCTVPVGSTSAVCNFKVPEARLYYSNLRFITGTQNPTKCALLAFFPYYYQRSNSATYKPSNSDTAINCSDPDVEKIPAKCFGGAAPTMVKEFPKNVGTYFLTNIASEANYDIKSSNSIRWYSKNVNYLITNSLTFSPGGRDTDVAGTYNERVKDTFADYEISCRNIWGEETSSITLFVSDENKQVDSYPGNIRDEFQDWF